MTLSSSLINCLCGELFILSAGGGLCLHVQWKVFRKFCPLCYEQVIALSPRRIKDKFSLVVSKFSQIALVAKRLGQFCENFENTRENLSLILRGLLRLYIQIWNFISAWKIGFSFFGKPIQSVAKKGLLWNNSRWSLQSAWSESCSKLGAISGPYPCAILVLEKYGI